jgi:hypothetical protein
MQLCKSLFTIALLLHSVGQTILDSPLLLARLASTTSPAFNFDCYTNRGVSRLSHPPLFVPANLRIRSGHRAGDTRFAATARFCCTSTHDRQKHPLREPHRCRHVADA